jgi:hypothetical protein
MRHSVYITCIGILILLSVTIAIPTFSQSPSGGILRGIVTDRIAGSPLPGAHVLVRGTTLGAATAADGSYVIARVPAGTYVLEFRSVGYERSVTTDVVVRPDRATRTDVALAPLPIEGEEVTTTAGYFPSRAVDELSSASFSFEEVRRSPGSAGDVSRIMTALPSVARVNDQRNSLAVRGGSPFENAFYIDDIPVPNINHFATQGATGGALGMLNVDLLDNVTLNAGGFGASWGNRISSIMDMRLREGDRHRFGAQANFDMTGIGGVAEGPLGDSTASWLVSFRHSYLDLIVNAFSVGNTVAPRMMDGQGKVTVDLSPSDQLNVLEMFSQDRLSTDHATAVENEMSYYGDQDNLQNSAGATWRHLWSASGVSRLTLSHTLMRFTETFRDIATQDILFANRSCEQSIDVRLTNTFALGRTTSLECGGDVRHEVSAYDNAFSQTTDLLGRPQQAENIRRDLTTTTAGAFVSFSFEPVSNLTATLGARVDHYGYSGHMLVSPRIALALRLSDRTSLAAAGGLYVQALPHVLLSHSPATSALREPEARHAVLGVSHLLAEDTRLTVELYAKTSTRLPVDVAQPQLFLLDEIYTGSTFLGSHPVISDAGEARSYGVEFMLQKKLARDFYGLASLSLGRSQYKALDGIWRDRVFDNRVSFCLEGGYKPDTKWDFSLRWVYGGGVPYTPLDLAASRQINAGVLDGSRINAERLPAYHSLNVRVDRRFNFDASSLVVYLSAWNVYDRKNVASYFWNKITGEPDTEYQFGLLPILGIEYEF